MRFYRYIKGSFILVLLITTNCCYTSDDLNQKSIERKQTSLNSNCNSPLNMLLISGQLSMNLGPGDSFEFSYLNDSDNALEFTSVHEFINFKNDHTFIYDYNVSQGPVGIHSTNFRDLVGQSFSLDISIRQKLDDEDHNQYYIIKDIVSNLNEIHDSRQWNQFTYSYNLFNGTAIIDLKGSLTYCLLINSIGVVFNDARHFKIIIDIHTGYPVSILELP